MNFRKEKVANFEQKRLPSAGQTGASYIKSAPFDPSKASGKTGTKASKDVIKTLLAEDPKAQKRALDQFEKNRKAGLAAKAGVAKVAAIGGEPERFILNKVLKPDAAKKAREIGRAGWKKGGNKFVNAAVGRTVTGKIARIGALGAAAGVTAAALNRQREQ